MEAKIKASGLEAGVNGGRERHWKGGREEKRGKDLSRDGEREGRVKT